jgi:hypothetical protein
MICLQQFSAEVKLQAACHAVAKPYGADYYGYLDAGDKMHLRGVPL